MENVLIVAYKILERIFITETVGQRSLFDNIVLFISRNPYISLGAIFLIIGFGVSIIKRIIHS